MPRPKKPPVKNPRDNRSDDFKGFAQVFLTDTDLAHIEEWQADNPAWPLLIDAGYEGYKFSLTYNERGKSWIASFYGARQSCGENFGWSLSGFGNDAERATTALLFKHFVVCEGGSWGGATQTQKEAAPYR